jgi:hypothetical protein
LILAAESDEPTVLLGINALEFQMRRAMLAGARHIVLMVQRLPASLLAAADALRREGVSVDIARKVGDAVDFVHPDDNVLLMPPRLFMPEGDVAQLCEQQGAGLLCIPRDARWPWLETVDATSCWTGCAVFNGTMLRDTAAMVGDWDLGSVLLRRLVQGNAAVTMIAGETLLPLAPQSAATLLGRRLIAEAAEQPHGAGEVAMVAPAGRMIAQVAGESGVRAPWLDRAALILCACGLGAAVGGWMVASLLLTLVAVIMAAAAKGLHRAIGTPPDRLQLLPRLILATIAIVLAFAGIILTQVTGQWGCSVLAFVVIATLAEMTFASGGIGQRWTADSAAALAILAVGTIIGLPVAALGVVALYATVSLIALRFRSGPKQA